MRPEVKAVANNIFPNMFVVVELPQKMFLRSFEVAARQVNVTIIARKVCPLEPHKMGLAHWAAQALIRHGNGLTNDLIVIYRITPVSSIFRATEFSIGEKSQCPRS